MVKFLLILVVLMRTRNVVALTTFSDTAFNSVEYAGFTNYTNIRPLNAFSKPGYPANCAEAVADTRRSGLYIIQVPAFLLQPFIVYCQYDIVGRGWTVIQRRQDGSVDFYREWQDYKRGFGKLEGDFWLGLDRIHALTNSALQEMQVVMEDFDSNHRFAKYASFAIGDESEGYALKVLGTWSGNTGDSMRGDEGNKFVTKDIDLDGNPDGNCAVMRTGAWWYKNCSQSNPNGRYLKGPYQTTPCCQGIFWMDFRGTSYSYKFFQIMLRPRQLK